MAIHFDPTGEIVVDNGPDIKWPWEKKADATGGDDNPTGGGTPAHKPGDVYYDAGSSSWVTVQPDGSNLPYQRPSTSGADNSGQPALLPDGSGRYGSITYDANGNARFAHDPSGQYVIVAPPTKARTFEEEAALRSMPTYSHSTSQQILDPSQQAQNNASAAALQAGIGQKDREIAQTDQDILLKQQTLAFTKQKESFAESQDNKRLALEAQQQSFNNQYQISTLTAQRTQLQSQRDQFNAQMQQTVNQANQGFENDRQDRLLKTNEDIAQFAAHPTDYGKLAAFALANKGFGQAAAKSGTADLTSDQSLQPLANSLDQRTQLQNEKSPYSFSPLPALAPIDLSQLSAATQPQQQANAPRGDQGFGQNGPPAGYYLPGTTPQQRDTLDMSSLARLIGGDTSALQGTDYAAAAGLPAKAQGGKVSGAYISGEAGPELNIPLGKGKALVLNAEQMKGMKAQHIKALAEMATGGVFNDGNVFDLNALTDTTGARSFRDQALQKATSNTPFGGGIHTPVFASSPGFNPLVTQLLGGLGELAGRGPADFYSQQANMLNPTGYNYNPIARQTPVGRTA